MTICSGFPLIWDGAAAHPTKGESIRCHVNEGERSIICCAVTPRRCLQPIIEASIAQLGEKRRETEWNTAISCLDDTNAKTRGLYFLIMSVIDHESTYKYLYHPSSWFWNNCWCWTESVKRKPKEEYTY